MTHMKHLVNVYIVRNWVILYNIVSWKLSLFETNLLRVYRLQKGLALLKMRLPKWSGFQKVQKLWVLILKDPRKFGYPKQKLDCVFIKGKACFKGNSTKKNHWYLDSGCLRHMTRDKKQFMDFVSTYLSGQDCTYVDMESPLINFIRVWLDTRDS